ncbi:MAG: hypothetical protein KF754_06800 [Planctomycetes bacterium]|nr:hypothetical protein [Planctomycetota bacterium]
MKYKKLAFLAQAFEEKYDSSTGTLTLVAVAASAADSNACQLIATPIPGTNPVQYEYSCLNNTCGGECVVDQSGTRAVKCKCVPLGALTAKKGKKHEVKRRKTRTS